MKVLIVGGAGFIGSAIRARLAARGHAVLIAGRAAGGPGHFTINLGQADIASWYPILSGVDAVINCAGTLQDAPGDSTAAVHHTGAAALFKACEATKVRRVIHFSAMGVDRATPSSFSRSKLAGDEALMNLDLDWIVLRPSVVIGRTAYGASALIRGLAALPVLPLMPESEGLQVVWLEDVAATVEHFISSTSPARQVVELAGPRIYSFEEIISQFRAWLRWPPARVFKLPMPAAKLLYRLGDFIALLGWRPPIRSTAQKEMTRGAISSGAANPMPFPPTDVFQALKREPASAQERWFAKLYFVKPLVFAVLAAFWLSTAFVSLGPGWEIGIGLMREGGIEGTPAALTVIAGALTDLCIGLAIVFRRTSRFGLYAAIAISFAYAIIGTILVPRLWADPLGPMLKIWPIIVLHLAALAIREDH